MAGPNDSTYQLGLGLEAFCERYDIPTEYFFEIINDQKVLPMLRGKGMEYNAYDAVRSELSRIEWSVEKLNVNAQPGTRDQDTGITYRRTAQRLIAESKSAVRGSMTSGERARIHRRIPHFKVKCHRSRSNITLAGTSNDRYELGAFDVLITNPSNALYTGGTIGDELELIDDQRLLAILYQHYGVSNKEDLLGAALRDWRFVLPSEIAEAGFIPRTPTVLLANDPHWRPLDQLEQTLFQVVSASRQPRR